MILSSYCQILQIARCFVGASFGDGYDSLARPQLFTGVHASHDIQQISVRPNRTGRENPRPHRARWAEGGSPGLHLNRASQVGEAVYAVAEPSLCVIAQGSKEVLLGNRAFRYDPAHT